MRTNLRGIYVGAGGPGGAGQQLSSKEAQDILDGLPQPADFHMNLPGMQAGGQAGGGFPFEGPDGKALAGLTAGPDRPGPPPESLGRPAVATAEPAGTQPLRAVLIEGPVGGGRFGAGAGELGGGWAGLGGTRGGERPGGRAGGEEEASLRGLRETLYGHPMRAPPPLVPCLSCVWRGLLSPIPCRENALFRCLSLQAIRCIYISIYPSIYLSIRLSIYLSILYIYTYKYIHTYLHTYMHHRCRMPTRRIRLAPCYTRIPTSKTLMPTRCPT